jgi:hypothetical protein
VELTGDDGISLTENEYFPDDYYCNDIGIDDVEYGEASGSLNEGCHQHESDDYHDDDKVEVESMSVLSDDQSSISEDVDLATEFLRDRALHLGYAEGSRLQRVNSGIASGGQLSAAEIDVALGLKNHWRPLKLG